MAISGTNYKGLTIADATPQGAAGLAAHNNFKKIADFMATALNPSATTRDAAYTVTVADHGKLILADATDAAFTITLPPADDAGDSFWLAVKKIDASANVVGVDGHASETIDGLPNYDLSSQYGFVVLRCDGSAWHVIAHGLDPTAIDADSLLLDYAPINYTEADATLAGHLFGIDVKLATTIGSVALSNVVVLEDQKAQGTDGQSITAGDWRTRDLNTEVSDTGNLCTLSSSQITLEAGTYLAIISAPLNGGGHHSRSRLQNVTDAETLLQSVNESATNIGGDNISTSCDIFGIFTIAVAKALEIQTRTSGTGNTGLASNFATEIYTRAIFIKLS